MPSIGDIVNTITIRGVADGVDATTAATKGLKDAFDAAAATAKSSAGDISGAFGDIQKSIGASGVGGGGGGLSFLASIGLGAAASAAGLGVFISWVQKTNKELADLGAAARSANLDLHDFQTLQFAAGVTGTSDNAFAAGAAKMATNLEEAARKDNDLSKLLDANNIKLKDGNKLLIDQNGLWDVARDLISRAANEQQKIKMADMIGAGKELVPLLSEGAAAFAASRSEAEKLGLVINDDVIARAKVFDDEWRKSSLVFSTWMKAQIADLIPTIDDLIAKAHGLAADISAAVTAGVNRLPTDTGQTSNEARAAAIMALIKNEDTLEEKGSAAILAFHALTGTLDENTKALIDNNIAAIAADKIWGDIATGMENAAAAGARIVNVPMPPTRAPSVLPPDAAKDGARDFWDRATDAVAKHTSQLNADSISVGQSVAVHDQLRAEFQLLEAARMADKGVTDDQIAAYTTLRGSMSSQQALTQAGIKLNSDDAESFVKLTDAIKAAAQANAVAKVNSDITFGQRTSFLSATDVQIATQLKTLYGNDVPAAMASSYAAAMRFNDAMKTLSATIENSVVSGLDSIIMHTATTGDAFRKMGLAVVSALDQMILKLLVIEPLMRSLQSSITSSGFGGLFSGLFGGGASATLAGANASATGVAASDVAWAFNSGGMVGRDGQRVMVSSAYFENAPRFDSGGMITDGGVPIIAHPGERVLNRQQTAAYNAGGGGATIRMGDIHIDASGADPAVVARLQSTLENFRKSQYADTVKIVQDASNRGLRLHA